jgi:hypothetical protein
MTMELSQPCIAPFEPTKDIRVTIACEGAGAAAHVYGVLERIGHNCATEGRLIYNWWTRANARQFVMAQGCGFNTDCRAEGRGLAQARKDTQTG